MMSGRGRVARRRVIIGLSALSLILAALLIGSFVHNLYSQSQKPELHPVALFLQPASPVEKGQLVSVTAKVINTGAIGADPFNVGFFYRPLSGNDQSWISFATSHLPGLTPSDQPTELQVVLDTSAAQLSPGNYQIRVFVDPEGQIAEIDKTNDEMIIELEILPSRLGLPDLRPADLTFTPPSPVTLSDTVVISSDIVNSGTSDAGGFSVGFSLCQLALARSSCRDEDFQAIAADPRTTSFNGLVQGGHITASTQLVISKLQLAPGTYAVRVFVDPPTPGSPNGQVIEQDKANNIMIAELNIEGPELHPTGFRFDKPFIRLGDQVNAFVTVENSGNASANDFDVAFLVNGKEFARATGSLDGRSSAEFQGTLKTGDPALALTNDVANTLRIVVDPDNRIPQLDRSTNVLQTGFTIQPALAILPELTPLGIMLNPSSPLEQGRDTNVTISAPIENTGKTAVNGFNVEISYRPAVSVRWIPIAPELCNVCRGLSLAPGASLTVQGQLALRDLNLAPGIYQVRVLIDPENAIAELDKANNEIDTSFTLLAPRLPKLVLTDIKLDLVNGIAHRGQLVHVIGTVQNQGDQGAGPFTVQFATCRVEALPGTPNVQNLPCTSGFTPFAQQDVSALAVGDQIAVTEALDTTNLNPGTYLIQVTAVGTAPSGPAGSGITTMLIAGPDLTVQALNLSIEFAPPNLLIAPTATIQMTQGEKATVSAQVANIGLEDAGAFNVLFSACPYNPTVGSQTGQICIPFGTQSFTGLGRNLAQWPTVTATFDTSSLAPGLYDVVVTADPPTPDHPFGQVADQVESNNSQSLVQTFFKPLEILPQPDLVPTSLVLNPPGPLTLSSQGPVAPGVQVEAFAEIENHGSGPALRPFIARFTVRLLTPLPPGASGPTQTPGQSFDDETLPGLAASARTAAKGILNTANLPVGSYEICVIVDPPDANHPHGRIPETDKTNNRLCIPPGLSPGQSGGPLPDLKPLTIKLTPPSPVSSGTPVKVDVTLTNAGGQAAGPFRVDFLIKRVDISGDILAPFGQALFNGLGVGETTTATATLDTSFRDAGTYQIVAVVDAGNQVQESNKDNNQISTMLIIR